MTKKNDDYESRQRDKGLLKRTLWVPSDREDDIKLAINMMIINPNLTINVLRDTSTGRVVSLNAK